MKIRVGIVGLPNVGKSSLFNTLAKKSIASAQNFPFCTIEPNIAPGIPIPDHHLSPLARVANSHRHVPAHTEWIDVAGLVRGASRGEGLGNRFLATVRECDAICHVLRDYEDDNVVHVDGRVDPAADAEVVNLEMLLADLAHVERRLEKVGGCVGEERRVLEVVVGCLRGGVPVRRAGLSEEDVLVIKSMGLLTLKPVLYVFNIDEVDFTFGREESMIRAENIIAQIDYRDPSTDRFTVVSAKFEAEMSTKNKKEQIDYFTSLGIEPEPSTAQIEDKLSYNTLPSIIREMLGLSTAYTGPGVPPERSKTTRAHLFREKSLTAAGLAGRIHGDLQRGFICAEVTSVLDVLACSCYVDAKDAGYVRTEGRDYVLSDGDVVLIKWK